MKFHGTKNYVATQDLMLSVNASITLQRPLLVKGEPGTGKTMLAEEVAQSLEMPLLQWHIKSTTKAQQGLYEYDAVSRLRDSQLSDIDGGERVKNIHNYIVKGVLWQAFTADRPVALLIDEIDKADIEFPNDLLREIDRMEFYCYETRELVKAKHRPLVFITSNNEKELPDAFLRRCFFHYIKFPDAPTMQSIVDVHFPGLKKELLSAAMKTFYDVRNLPGLKKELLSAAMKTFFEVRSLPGLKKKPSPSELLDWLKLLLAEDIPADALQSKDEKMAVPPLVGALLKNEQDVTLFEKLMFMQRHNR
jgi:MoxR-like ATPase